MLKIQQFVQPKSLQEAYELLQKNRNNQIIAGMLWLKMEDRSIPTAIDLQHLVSDQIEESDDHFTIGANVTLRMFETHPALNQWMHHVCRDSVKDIVGVQFRNLATVGGSVYARFGFSDVICALLACDATIILYKGGEMPLEEFVQSPYQRDILTHIVIPKQSLPRSFVCMRKSATDISTLNLSVVKKKEHYQFAVGGRPQKAICIQLPVEEDMIVAKKLRSLVPGEGNMRASKEYREALVEALCRKALKKLEETA